MRFLYLLAAFVGASGWALRVGERAPDFRLPATDGKEYSLNEALKEHQGVVVAFLSVGCAYSNSYNTRLNQLAQQLGARAGGKKVALFAVNANAGEGMAEVRRHAASQSYQFAVLKDDGGKVANAFGATKTPEVFFVGSQGNVLYHGRIDDDTEGTSIQRQDLLVAVDESLAGRPVRISQTKAFGCPIQKR